MDEVFIQFLIKAKTGGYAAGDAMQKVTEDDGSFSTIFTDSNLRFHDNWFGGEPFGGREVVHKNGKPYWMMAYYGADFGTAEGVIDLLRKALSQPPKDMPVRGPEELSEGNLRYENTNTGDIKSFRGIEAIYSGEEEVYITRYIGGLVNQRED